MEKKPLPNLSAEAASTTSETSSAAESLEPCFIFDADPDQFAPDFTHFRTASNATAEPAPKETRTRTS